MTELWCVIAGQVLKHRGIHNDHCNRRRNWLVGNATISFE